MNHQLQRIWKEAVGFYPGIRLGRLSKVSKTSARVAGGPAETGTEHLPNASLGLYLQGSLFDHGSCESSGPILKAELSVSRKTMLHAIRLFV
jgi:hypothetical protein